MTKLMELGPGNTKDASRERAWDPQGIRGATDATEPQVVHKGQQRRNQIKQNIEGVGPHTL